MEGKKELVEGVDYIVVDVHCTICDESISPKEADMELFRIGVPVHNIATKARCWETAVNLIVKGSKL